MSETSARWPEEVIIELTKWKHICGKYISAHTKRKMWYSGMAEAFDYISIILTASLTILLGINTSLDSNVLGIIIMVLGGLSTIESLASKTISPNKKIVAHGKIITNYHKIMSEIDFEIINEKLDYVKFMKSIIRKMLELEGGENSEPIISVREFRKLNRTYRISSNVISACMINDLNTLRTAVHNHAASPIKMQPVLLQPVQSGIPQPVHETDSQPAQGTMPQPAQGTISESKKSDASVEHSINGTTKTGDTRIDMSGLPPPPKSKTSVLSAISPRSGDLDARSSNSTNTPVPSPFSSPTKRRGRNRVFSYDETADDVDEKMVKNFNILFETFPNDSLSKKNFDA